MLKLGSKCNLELLILLIEHFIKKNKLAIEHSCTAEQHNQT